MNAMQNTPLIVSRIHKFVDHPVVENLFCVFDIYYTLYIILNLFHDIFLITIDYIGLTYVKIMRRVMLIYPKWH